MSALSVRGLTLSRAGKIVLEDVSFTAPAGSLTCVLGASCAGKTSLLAAIAGLIAPDRGAVLRGAAHVTGARARGHDVALLPPGTALPESRTVRGALRRLAGRGQNEACDRMAASLALDLASPTATLSHGQAALALTAARLSARGDILLVDEAGEGLDDPARHRLMAVLRREAEEGRTIVMASRATWVGMHADHLVLLSGGRTVQAGTPASLYARPCDGAAACLTGAANILQGTIRELQPGAFVWSAGSRHVQAAEAETLRPVLGSPVRLCLRPERVTWLDPVTGQADNIEDGVIRTVRSTGPALDVCVETRLGLMQAHVPSRAIHSSPVAGATVRLGWAADAATLLA